MATDDEFYESFPYPTYVGEDWTQAKIDALEAERAENPYALLGFEDPSEVTEILWTGAPRTIKVTAVRMITSVTYPFSFGYSRPVFLSQARAEAYADFIATNGKIPFKMRFNEYAEEDKVQFLQVYEYERNLMNQSNLITEDGKTWLLENLDIDYDSLTPLTEEEYNTIMA